MARELTSTTLELLEEFTVAWLRGESPDPRVTLERAPEDERADLSALIDRFLAAQPARSPTAETLAQVREIARMAEGAAEDASPATAIARLRVSRGLSVDAVVDRLRTLLGLGAPLAPRLRAAYSDLERDWLDPRGVQPPVWSALAAIFAAEARKLVMAESEPPLAAVLMRSEGPPDIQSDTAGVTFHPRDEIDDLFRGAPIEE